jgi:hypothetical protein
MVFATCTARVGALAVALGMGAAAISAPGVAYADPAPSSSDSASPSSGATDVPPTGPSGPISQPARRIILGITTRDALLSTRIQNLMSTQTQTIQLARNLFNHLNANPCRYCG